MPDVKTKKTDLIIGTGLITAEAIASELRTRLIRTLGNRWRYLTHFELLENARNLLREFEPIIAENIARTDLAAWVAGMDQVSKQLPPYVLETFGRLGGFGTGKPPGQGGGLIVPDWFGDGGEPTVRFPIIERAAERLAAKQILRKDDFDRASDAVKAHSFTIAGDASEDTLETIRDVLAETVDEGASLESFRRNLGDRLERSFIGPGHLETVYRTNVQSAFHDGHDELASDPIVAEVFPYQEILPIFDARGRKTHASLAHLGLSGTGIYRRDDFAFWRLFRPPIEWNCRCGVNLLTIEAAARAGVEEAEVWLRTGVRPPLFSRLPFIPWRPDPSFVSSVAA